MSKQETYKFGFINNSFHSNLFYDYFCKKKPKLAQIVLSNRIAKKICRKCYKRLPLNSNVCRSCKNPDLRTQKGHILYYPYAFDKKTKNKLIEKRNAVKKDKF